VGNEVMARNGVRARHWRCFLIFWTTLAERKQVMNETYYERLLSFNN
jgi:hypothetical protein